MMNKRALRLTAIGTIFLMLFGLGVGEVLAYFFTTPSRHIDSWLVAAVCAFAILWGIVFYVRTSRRLRAEEQQR
jgi:hypothetical protein